ncbi:hypothetical protein N0V88_003487 [Collariella sp. IMI 366227]|nr:hypothetical protein N0V88_003487 [Collariella sp. IMI 366227]
MATSLSPDEHVGAARDALDPFVASPPGPTRLRHSNFDTHLFALAPGSSAEQVKRAIEAHLRDTERRMEEAGKLGTALVQQQRQLTEKLREVEQLQSEAELNPELRQRLVEIEKDYNEVARESARALLPKQRVPSNETQGSQSPFSPEGKGAARRSVSPSKFETLAAPSPTKFGVPNRKVRNQPASRVHDIEFAAEISTSLIAQVRNLQALLAQREDELKDAKLERSELERESEGLQQRLKNLDESENRYKDENWNLETHIRELMAGQKDAADREKKLTQALKIVQAERNATQRELEEVKDSLAKQDEKHSAEIKGLEIEIGTSRRNAVTFETERSGLQRKVEELTNQNQEFAKAFSALQRGRALERENALGVSEEDFHSAPDHNTPDHSPPPSPMKPTPRHSALESETLKTSLGHAQRTIQTLRTNIHREKTEKLEMKRMLQDARDEIEKLRNDPHTAPKKSRKSELREAKKPSFKLNQLGVPRSSRMEVVEDPEWEDQSEAPSPRALSHRGSTMRLAASVPPPPPVEPSSDHFETANETSDAAFETAHERGTETEDFQTGVEDMSDDDDVATETEAIPTRALNSIKRPPPLPPHHLNARYSFDSTASTSSDDDDYRFSSEMRTPSAGRIRNRLSRGSLSRRSRRFSEEPALQGSPANFPANNASAIPGGQSLFAELNDLDSDEDSSSAGAATPSRRSIRSGTPATPRSVIRGRVSPPPEVPALPKIMVDSGTMTDPIDFQPTAALVEAEGVSGETGVSSPQTDTFLERPSTMESVIGPHRADISTELLGDERQDGVSPRLLSSVSYSDASVQHEEDMDAPSPALSISSIYMESIEPRPEPELPPNPPPLSISSLLTEQTEPVTETVELPPLSMPSLLSVHVEPVVEPAPAPPLLSMPILLAQDIEPVSAPEPTPPLLSVPVTLAQDIEPVSAPEPVPPLLSESVILAQDIEPVAEPEPPLPKPPTLSAPVIVSQDIEPTPATPASLSFSTVHAEQVEPIAEPEEALPSPILLSSPDILCEEVEPVELPAPVVEERSGLAAVIAPLPVPLSLSSIASKDVEPQIEEPASPIKLSVSPVYGQEVQPLVEPETPAPSLSLASIKAVDTAPLETPAPPLALSSVQSWGVEPVDAPEVPPPTLALSGIVAQNIEPVQPQEPKVFPPSLSLSSIQAQNIEPVQLEEPKVLPPPLSVSGIQAQNIEPVQLEEPKVLPPSLSLSSLQVQNIEPIQLEEPTVLPPLLALSGIEAQNIEPNQIEEPKVAALLSFSGIRSLHIEPVEPRSPKRDAIITSRDAASAVNSVQLPTEDVLDHRHQLVAKTDQGAQTTLTSEVIDQMLKDKAQSFESTDLERSSSFSSMATPSTVRVHRPRRGSVDSPLRSKGKMPDFGIEGLEFRRPGSSASGMASVDEVPPLPANHKEAIEAARTGSSHGGQGTIGSMGPPLFPASTLRPQAQSLRPRTPTGSRRPISPVSVASGRGTPTPRAAGRPGFTPGTADIYEVQSISRGTLRSRKSSISSFTSEMDTRFNMHHVGGFDPQGLGPNTDPRMIQAITQTMIGEYLWKYTRKAGRGEMSEKRHRRYFWVHPYTRTLYWSDRDPSTAGRSELRAKSVQIEAVRVVADDNPMPPGLHRKSLIIMSPGRSIKFTCTTGQRHETWFNALSYLLLRTANEGVSDAEEIAGNITREDVEEFNPPYGRRQTNGSRAPPSVISSSNSQTVRQSPVMDVGIPTLTPSRSKASQNRASYGTLSRISGYLGSMRGRSVQGRESVQGFYEQHSDIQDSAEDVRQMIERQDREADRLENVRACCDGHSGLGQDEDADDLPGKHDVGTLTSSAKRGRSHAAGFRSPTPGPSATPTPVGTIRSRA